MLFATMNQARLFVWMMAAGVAMGAWYLLTALLRRFVRAGFWLSLGCDLLFALGSAALFMAALIAANYGQARLFEILGFLLGAALFGAGMALPLRAPARRLRQRVLKIMSGIARNRLIKVIFK